MTKYEDVKELAQAFTTQLSELKDAQWNIQDRTARVSKQFAVVQQAIGHMTTGTIPEVAMDWDELDELVKDVKKELDYVQGKIEDAHGEVQEVASYGASAESYVEQASESFGDDLKTNFTKLSKYVKEMSKKG